MYHPDENNYFNDKLSVNIEEVEISTKDGLALLGWYHEKDIRKNKTILFFHGNAGSLAVSYTHLTLPTIFAV